MVLSIINNISALQAGRNLNNSGGMLGKSLQRLSSGLRINTASDDPAGLTISEDLRARYEGFQKANQDIQAGNNILNIAEGALTEINTLLKSARGLVLDAISKGTVDDQQVGADQAELDNILSSIQRISATTKYGDKYLLNGTMNHPVFHRSLSSAAALQLMASNGTGDAVAGDFNNDGWTDIATTVFEDDRVSVLLNDGTGNFLPYSQYSVDSPLGFPPFPPGAANAERPLGMASLDINGDGNLDIVTANLGDLTTQVLLGNGAGGFAMGQTVNYMGAPGMYTFEGPFDIKAADIDGDSVQELVATSINNGIAVLNNAGGVLSWQSIAPAGGVGGPVQLGDLDGDGDIDAATVDPLNGNFRPFFNNGAGVFTAGGSFAMGSLIVGLGLGDFNGDGATDVVSTSNDGNSVHILFNQGGGNFGNLYSAATGTNGPETLSVVDFDGDGNDDVVVSSFGGYGGWPPGPVPLSRDNRAVVFFGDGAGALEDRSVVTLPGVSPRQPVVADFNQDGSKEVVMGVREPTLADPRGYYTSFAINVTITWETDFDIQHGPDSGDKITDINIPEVSLHRLGLLDMRLNSIQDCRDAFDKIDAADKSVATSRANLGARIMELDHLSNSNSVGNEMVMRTDDSLRNANMAEESSQFARNQILVQAGTAILAQANSQQQNILSLLQSLGGGQ